MTTKSNRPGADLTRNDRFALLLVIGMTAGALLLGVLLQQQTRSSTWRYDSRQAGIEAAYPSGWLIDESGSYVVRMLDPKARPFKTQYSITTFPAGGQTSVRNVLDSLTLQRSSDLAAYRVLSVEDISAGGTSLTQMRFAFVDSDPNPFIQRLPVVVQGVDVVILDNDRAIVATYMAEESEFEQGLTDFERFLASLRY